MDYQIFMVFSVESPNKGLFSYLFLINLSLVTYTECSLKTKPIIFLNGAENISCLDNEMLKMLKAINELNKKNNLALC